MRFKPEKDYPTLEEIKSRMNKGFEIDEDWITNKAQQKQDKEDFKNLKKSKIFR